MIVISSIGGSGSSFLVRNFQRFKYNQINFNHLKKILSTFHWVVDPFFKLTSMIYERKNNFSKISLRILRGNKPALNNLTRPNDFWPGSIYNPTENFRKEFRSLLNLTLKKLGKIFKILTPNLVILTRPDSYRSEFMYDPESESYKNEINKLKSFIFETIHTRSGGLKIDYKEIDTTSIESLVKTYIEEIIKIEKKKKVQVVLLSCSWGEHRVFKNLGIETVYLVRDPFNSLISYSKSIRHEDEFLRRGLKSINTKEWIDAYLDGPIHFWINHTRVMLEHEKSIIVRYNYFKDDWKLINNVPNISKFFNYKENDVTKILNPESIEYIRYRTRELCEKLDLPVY